MSSSNSSPSYTYNVPSPPDSESSSNPPKKIKLYDSNNENMVYREGYTSNLNGQIYNQQRAQALDMMEDDRFSVSSISSSTTSSRRYPPTPPPDYAVDVCLPSSQFFPNYAQRPLGPPPLRYFEPEYAAPARSSSEHNYAVQDSPAAVSVIQAPQSARARNYSYSSTSTISDLNELNPICMNEWHQDAVGPEHIEKLKGTMATIKSTSSSERERHVEIRRTQELPTEMEPYNPNKSRLRKVYQSPVEQAEREKNNDASRKSRFRRKCENMTRQMYLDFDRDENAKFYRMQNWLGQVIFDLEEQCMDRGIPLESLVNARKQCGFSRRRGTPY